MLGDRDRVRRWFVRLAAVGAVAGGLALAPRILLGGDGKLDRLRADQIRMTAAIREREASNAGKRRRIRALRNDPRAIEDLARVDLGMVQPGELVIRVEGTP